MASDPIEARLREAQAYHSMGLYNEALSILTALQEQHGPAISEEIQSRIDRMTDELKTAIEQVSQEDPQFQDETIALLRQSWTLGEANLNEILSSAEAFRELGLYGEALAEYAKLLNAEELVESVLPDLSDCLFQLHPPARTTDQISRLLDEHNLAPARRARILFYFAEQLETRAHPDLAMELFDAVHEIDPDYDGLAKKTGGPAQRRLLHLAL